MRQRLSNLIYLPNFSDSTDLPRIELPNTTIPATQNVIAIKCHKRNIKYLETSRSYKISTNVLLMI